LLSAGGLLLSGVEGGFLSSPVVGFWDQVSRLLMIGHGISCLTKGTAWIWLNIEAVGVFHIFCLYTYPTTAIITGANHIGIAVAHCVAVA